ncbi:MAG: amino protease [Clostridiaceae bacterium]|jgi:membrane protease YdiL (CAAX protease family)|nr:amino protease [Clostridiaceae bacterium]
MRKISIKYILITFSISYLLWFFLAFIVSKGVTQVGQPIFMILFILGGLAPTASAIITKITNKDDFRLFKNQLFKLKLNILWYIGILTIPLIISGISWLLTLLLSSNPEQFLQKPIYLVFAYIPIMIIGGGLEELGWRGVLLPGLLKKTSPFKATLIISFIWSLWHIPLWFIKGSSQYGSNYLIFVLNLISLAFLLSLLYIKTKSIFVCVLLHSIYNSYMAIGLNSWAYNNLSQIINITTTLIISLSIFTIFIKRKDKSINAGI